MDFIASPLKTVLFLRMQLSNGVSMRMALNELFVLETDEFHRNLFHWYRQREQNSEHDYKTSHIFRSQVIMCINRGLKGEPVLDLLRDLEKEMISVSKEDIDAHIDRLPIILMLPMVIFQLPAFLTILIGPIFIQLFKTLGVS